METMEQHVFRTYEAKYGLRSIAVEHAGALLRSLLKHSSTDNEVSWSICFFDIFVFSLCEWFCTWYALTMNETIFEVISAHTLY